VNGYTIGWSYFEKLAQQKVMQVRSAADPPKKIMVGERAAMADGNDYNLVLFKDQGQPVETVYAVEGSPLITVPAAYSRARPIQMPRGCSRASCSAPRHSSSLSIASRIARSTRW
jgi:hypothetical protein